MQAGQLDAGFFYSVEAKTAKLSAVPLAPVYKYAEYTITILDHASNPTGAAALIRYLLSRARTFTLSRNGLNPTRPKFAGSPAAVPAGLRATVGRPLSGTTFRGRPARATLACLGALLALYLLGAARGLRGASGGGLPAAPGAGSALAISLYTATISAAVIALLGVPLAYVLAHAPAARSCTAADGARSRCRWRCRR